MVAFLRTGSRQLAVLAVMLAVAGTRLAFAGSSSSKQVDGSHPLETQQVAISGYLNYFQSNVWPTNYDIDLTIDPDAGLLEGKVDVMLQFGKMNPRHLGSKAENKLWALAVASAGQSDREFVLEQEISRVDASNYILMDANANIEIVGASLVVASSFDELNKEKGHQVSVDKVLRLTSEYHTTPLPLIAIRLKEDLKAEWVGKLSIEYKSEQVLATGKDAVFSFAKMQDEPNASYFSTLAQSLRRELLPCFEHPKYEATFKLAISLDPTHGRPYSNMPEESYEQVAETNLWKTTFHATTKPAPIHDLVFALGPFDKEPLTTKSKEGTEIRLVTQRGFQDQATFALNMAKRAADWLEEYTGIKHPLGTVTLVATHSMEKEVNSDGLGIGLVKPKYLLYDESEHSLEQKGMSAFGVALAMARQWFGKIKRAGAIDGGWPWRTFNWLYTKYVPISTSSSVIRDPTDRRYLWITEGLAVHFALRMVRELEPECQLDEHLRTKLFKNNRIVTDVAKFWKNWNKDKLPYLIKLIDNAAIFRFFEKIRGDRKEFDKAIKTYYRSAETLNIDKLAKAFELNESRLLYVLRAFEKRRFVPMLFMWLNKRNQLAFGQAYFDFPEGERELFWPIGMKVQFLSADGSQVDVRDVPVKPLDFKMRPRTGTTADTMNSVANREHFVLDVPDWFDSTCSVKLIPESDESLPFYRWHYSPKYLGTREPSYYTPEPDQSQYNNDPYFDIY